MVDFMTRRMISVKALNLHADDNDPTTYPLTIDNYSRTAKLSLGAYGMTPTLAEFLIAISTTLRLNANNLIIGQDTAFTTDAQIHARVPSATKGAMTSESVGTAQARAHLNFRNSNGLVGTISTSASATAYNTTSDENWKVFEGEYDPKKAVEVIRADPVRGFHWDEEHGGGYAVGWGAQTSYGVSPDLASPGGWFDEDGHECDANAEGAVYVPWGVDQSKRTPYLWATVSWLLDERDSLIKRIEALEGGKTSDA
jgi:hypothetical protein